MDNNPSSLSNAGRQTIYATEQVQFHKQEEIVSKPKVFYDETPARVLERETLILDQTMAAGPVNFFPYELLRNKFYFQRFSRSFRYFRAGIKLRVQINSNPQNYGFVLINYWPNITAIGSSIYAQVNAKPHLMDLSATQSLEIVVPYIHHYRWLDIYDPIQWTNIQFSYTSVSATVQTQVIPVSIQIWASFVNPEFDGAYDSASESVAQSEIEISERPNLALAASTALPLAVIGTSTAMSAYQSLSSMVSNFVNLSSKVENVEKTSNRIKNLFKLNPEAIKEPQDLRPQYIGGIASLGQVPTVTLDAYPRQKFPPCELGDPNLVHSVSAICKIPTIRHITTLTTSSVPFTIALDPGQSDNLPFISYYEMMACMYRYWRGSIKVNVKIFTSPLISGRAILRLTNAWGLSGSSAARENETPYRKIVTIKGSTEISMTVPFIYDKWWKKTGDFSFGAAVDHINALSLDIISPLTSPGDLAPSIIVVVSVAGGDDFQLKGYTCWRDPLGEVQAQSLSDEWSSKSFEPFCSLQPLSNLIELPELDDTLELLMSRYSGRAPLVDFMHVNTNPTVGNSDNFDYIIRMCRYWRGSVRFKAFIDWDGVSPSATYWEAMMDDEKTTGTDYKPTTQGISRGCAFNKSDNGAPVEFIQPYFSETEWTARGQLGNVAWEDHPEYVIPLFLSGSAVDRVLLAAGHDFQMAYLLPPFTRTSSAYVI